MKKLFFIAMLFLSACSTQNVITGQNVGRLTYNEQQHFFIGGIGQTRTVNASNICKGRPLGMVKTTYTPLDVVFNAITFGIYSPRTLAIYCK